MRISNPGRWGSFPDVVVPFATRALTLLLLPLLPQLVALASAWTTPPSLTRTTPSSSSSFSSLSLAAPFASSKWRPPSPIASRSVTTRKRRAAAITTTTTEMNAASSGDETASAAAEAAAASEVDDGRSGRGGGKIASGSVVTVECRLVPLGDFVPEPLIDGVVLEDDGDEAVELTFVLDGGNYLPGLHEVVRDRLRDAGDRVSDVTVDAGWGARNEELVVTVNFDDVPNIDRSQISQPGATLYLGSGIPCTVTAVTDANFTFDANPPLAGASYGATVKLLNVEEPPVLGSYRPARDDDDGSRYDVATFALGCFWGGELEYMREVGVVGTMVGYTQGDVKEPTYEQVCTGKTGHTEAMVVTYDPDVVTYERLCRIAMDRLGENKFLLNRVGNDRGTQYRHGIYYHDDAQKEVAERVVAGCGPECKTEVMPAQTFYRAEDYHQQYLLKGGQSARKNDPSVIRCYG